MTVAFTAENGRDYRIERDVLLHDYELFEIGEIVTVRYLENAPRNADIVDTLTVGSQQEIIILLIVLIIALLYVVYFWVIRPAQINQRLETQGQLLIGTIQNAYPLKTSAGYKVNIEFSFKPPDEETMSRHSAKIRKDMVDKSLPISGTTVLILYVNKHFWRLM